MTKFFRQLSLLAALFAGCDLVTLPAHYRVDTDFDFGVSDAPVSYVLQPGSCAPAKDVSGGGAGAPKPEIVSASPRTGALIELLPMENCSSKSGGTITQIVCTVPASNLPANFDKGYGFRIDGNGTTALPSVPISSISAVGSIDVGTTQQPSVTSITTPVNGFAMPAQVPTTDAPWKFSANSTALKLNGNDLQIVFKALISCGGGGATLSTPFHWQVDILTVTPMKSLSNI